uniref:Uncharacterized protein n=1 Tax=Panagrolaimus davidi TaxID=227884 RepID=A0A914QMZ1_9BILA
MGNRDAVIIYHARGRSYVFQIKRQGYHAVCVQCQNYHNTEDKNFRVKSYRLNGDNFIQNPGDPENHRCAIMTRGKVEAEQLYR